VVYDPVDELSGDDHAAAIDAELDALALSGGGG
jgi:hypothetical protein